MKTAKDREIDKLAERLKWLRASKEAARRGIPAPPAPGEPPRGIDHGIIAVHPPKPGGKLNDPHRDYDAGPPRPVKPAAQVDRENEEAVQWWRSMRAFRAPPGTSAPAAGRDPYRRGGNNGRSAAERDFRAKMRAECRTPAEYQARLAKHLETLRWCRDREARGEWR